MIRRLEGFRYRQIWRVNSSKADADDATLVAAIQPAPVR